MAVLLTYHKLVERDAKNIDVQWKVSSIILVVCAIFCSLVVSLSLQQLIIAFDDRCLLEAKVEFENVKDQNNHLNLTSELDGSESTLATMSTVWMVKKFLTLSDVFNETYAAFLSRKTQHAYPRDQVQFLVDNKINDRLTVWGKKNSCEFGVYIPIFQSCFGIIMATMFVICGRGGKTDAQSFLPQPWRIVLPAIVFFLVMTVLSIVNLVVIESGMKTFCSSFEKQLPDVGCDIGLNRYTSLSMANLKFSPSVLHIMLKSFNYITCSLWLTSLLVLLARIILVIDFQLVRVTVKTIEFEKTNETSDFREVQIEENGKDESGELLATTMC